MNAKLSVLFLTLALVLSHTLCAVVAANYVNLWWGGQYAGYSFPTYTAFFLAIPYGAGVLLCLGLAWFFHRR